MRRGVVLCIGNDPVNLNLRGASLADHGWKVILAGTGHEGVFRFAEGKVDAVTIDLNHDGSESALITGELKRQRPQVPVIMIVNDPKTLLEGATQLADCVILKSEEALLLHPTLKRMIKPSEKTSADMGQLSEPARARFKPRL